MRYGFLIVMEGKRLLSHSRICMNLQGETKSAILRELVDLYCASEKRDDGEAIFKEVLAREEKLSTGIQYGFAIPHARTDLVSQLTLTVGLSPQGVDFQSLDGEKTRVFILILSPTVAFCEHIQVLADLGSLMGSQIWRNKLLKTHSADEVLAAFNEV